MNLLILSELYPPHGSGAETATQLYAKLVAEKGFNVKVITNRFANEPTQLTDESLSIYRLALFAEGGNAKFSLLKRSDIFFSSFFLKMMKWADVVYIPSYWFSAILVAKSYRKPVVVHLHDHIPVCPLSTLYDEFLSTTCLRAGFGCSPRCIDMFEKKHGRNRREVIASLFLNSSIGRYLPKLIRYADKVICVSQNQRDLMACRFPALAKKLFVIHNPVPDFSETLPVRGDFGYFGGSDHLKGFGVLCKALSLLKDSSTRSLRIHCTKFQDNHYRFQHAWGDFPFKFYGRLSREDFDRVYGYIETVLVPSIWHEPLPYVVSEALLRGRLVIASKIGGIPEQVEGCRGVFLCEAGDYSKIAISIRYVNEMPSEEKIELGLQNRRAFRERFNNDSSVRKFMNACETV